MSITRQIFISFTILSAPALLQPLCAQQKIDPVLEVRRDFDAKLLEIQKGKLNTTYSDTLSNFNLNFNYSIFDKAIKDLYEFSPLPSAQIESSAAAIYPVFYGNLGLNIPLNPHLDMYYQPNLPSNLSLTVYAKHNSFWGDVPLVNTVRNSTSRDKYKVSAPSYQNNAGVNFGYSWKGGEMGINLDYKKDLFSFYGYNQPEDIEYILPVEISVFAPDAKTLPRRYNLSYMKDTLSHTYDKIGGKFFIRSTNNRPNSFYYNLGFSYSRIGDKGNYEKFILNNQYNTLRDFNENYICINGAVGPKFGKFNKFLFGFRYQTSNSTNTNSLDRYDMEIHPYYTFSKDRWLFELGLRFDKYVIPSVESFNIFLTGNITYEIAKNRLWLYAMVDGKNNFRTYQGTMEDNPWITPNIELRTTEEPIIARIGLKGEIKERLSYHIYGGYTKYINHMNLNYYSSIWIGPRNSFIPVYKDMHKLGIGGEFFWKSTDFESGLSFEYNDYTNKDSSTVYNLPPFELNAFGRYNWRERLIFGASLHYRSKTQVLYHFNPFKDQSLNSDNEFTSSFATLNLDVTYVYNKKISFYLKLNNILDASELYQMYYSSPGIGAGAGVIFKL